jgi:apolipoprotein N-acyltransferase
MLSKGVRADGLALIAGGILPLAFAPFGLFPVAFVSPLLLFLTWREAEPRRAFLRGWLFGAAAFGAGVSWIHESFQFSNIGLPIAVSLTVVFVAFLALYPALLGYAVRRFRRSSGQIDLLLVYPAAWTLVEWLRGWLFTGFTWLQLGYSQTDSPLAGFLPLTGIYGVSWLTALTASLALWAILGAKRERMASVILLVAIFAGGATLRGVPWTERAGADLKVVMVQGNVPQDEKWLPSMRQPTLERYLSHTRRHWDADLIVWPETAVPGLVPVMQPFIEALDAEARQHDTDVLFGIPAVDAASRRYLNSLVLVGGHRGVYHKRHLVPFGEYLPFDALLRPITESLGIPVANFSPGPKAQPLFKAGGYPVSASVCYEIAFGAEIIRSLPEARFLVTVSNDAWFGNSIGPHQHLQIARARAAETGRYLLRATNTGITAIIAPDGSLVSRAAQFEVGVLSGRIEPRAGATPYVVWGDWPAVVIMLILIVAPWAWSRRRGETAGAA